MSPTLQVHNVSMVFGGVTAIRNVDLIVQEREIRCLIGPNGAGKSTLFKIIAGQLRPSAGHVVFHGTDITGGPSYRIARLGVGTKTQVPQLFDGLSVYENIWLAAYRSWPRNKAAALAADELLEELGIAEHRDSIVDTLAHGLRQRTEIAVVLAGRPRLILLDEPAAGMSDAEVDEIAAIIRRVGQERTIIVVEHDMRFVRAISTRVTVLHQGSVFLEDEAGVVLADASVRDIYFGGRKS
jgi:branched-chain amino acid transport system ATP-binding protein